MTRAVAALGVQTFETADEQQAEVAYAYTRESFRPPRSSCALEPGYCAKSTQSSTCVARGDPRPNAADSERARRQVG